MRKKLILMFFFIMMLLTTSCSMKSIELHDSIESPRNNNIPICGRWVFTDYKLNAISNMDEEKAQSYIGLEAIFHEEFVTIGDENCIQPSFRLKKVDVEGYLKYHYKIVPEILNLESGEIEVISVSGLEQFFYEFLKVSDDTILVNINGVFFTLKKTSDDVEFIQMDTLAHEGNVLMETAELTSEESIMTGVLLGLKSLDLENSQKGVEKWNYRTLFIRSVNREIVSIYEMENILLPRRTGFWKVKVDRQVVDGKINDNIIVYPLNKSIAVEEEDKLIIEAKLDSTIKNILYVGNDYISIENIHYRSRGERLLEFYPVDSIGKSKPLQILDVMGEMGREAFMEGFNREVLPDKEEYKNSLIDIKPDEESFGLFRKNGHWIFNGRVNFIENGIYSYKNFNIKAIPPKEVVYYDELAIPWNKIKAKIPEALDAFTSPNEDILIVLTQNDIFIYTLEGDNISEKPMENIKLKPAEKVIMAEWAVGRYPKIWEDEFLKNISN